jgi:hypothetical protein
MNEPKYRLSCDRPQARPFIVLVLLVFRLIRTLYFRSLLSQDTLMEELLLLGSLYVRSEIVKEVALPILLASRRAALKDEMNHERDICLRDIF